MRIGMPAFFAACTTCSTLSGPPMFPGLMRTAATPASIALSASDALKWMSAITGKRRKPDDERQRRRVLVLRHRDADDLAARPTRAPRSAPSSPATSCVFVSVIDCTTTGAPPPMSTSPTRIWTSLATARG